MKRMPEKVKTKTSSLICTQSIITNTIIAHNPSQCIPILFLFFCKYCPSALFLFFVHETNLFLLHQTYIHFLRKDHLPPFITNFRFVFMCANKIQASNMPQNAFGSIFSRSPFSVAERKLCAGTTALFFYVGVFCCKPFFVFTSELVQVPSIQGAPCLSCQCVLTKAEVFSNNNCYKWI